MAKTRHWTQDPANREKLMRNIKKAHKAKQRATKARHAGKRTSMKIRTQVVRLPGHPLVEKYAKAGYSAEVDRLKNEIQELESFGRAQGWI